MAFRISGFFDELARIVSPSTNIQCRDIANLRQGRKRLQVQRFSQRALTKYDEPG